MEREKLNKILDDHGKWLLGKTGGIRADLRSAYLERADLQDANLQDADLERAYLRSAYLERANLRSADLERAYLRGADLRGADLERAYLRSAYLERADLQDANLQDADLKRAYLRSADLKRADLQDANLQDANLQDANLQDADLPKFQIPQTGTLEVWKKASGKIVKLLVPAEAKRTASLVGRKCRAEFAMVLDIVGGGPVVTDGMGKGVETVYTVGEIVRPDSYDDDIRIECSHGIHFFLTEEEAEEF